MKLTLTHDEMDAYCSDLHDSNAAFNIHYPADSCRRQPVHTVYGGAKLITAGFSAMLGEMCIRDRRAGWSSIQCVLLVNVWLSMVRRD